MAVRKTIGRYKTIPSGYDFENVLKRGKAFHKNTDFEMQPHKFGERTLWSAETVTQPPFKAPEGTILLKRLTKGWQVEKK